MCAVKATTQIEKIRAEVKFVLLSPDFDDNI